jgi:hypothetical protein
MMFLGDVDVQRVAVGVGEVNLRDVGAGQRLGPMSNARGAQPFQQRLQSGGPEREMRQAKPVRLGAWGRVAGRHLDEMHDRAITGIEPRAGEPERRPRPRRQPQHGAIERHQLAEPSGPDVHVIERKHREASRVGHGAVE